MFEEIPISRRSISLRTLVQGIGLNDAPYKVQITVNNTNYTCPYYTKWSKMLGRCYSKAQNITKPSYKDCTVCEEWLTFSNFKSWMENQDWEGKELDKDILEPFNTVYSPNTCIFVDKTINNLLNKYKKKMGKYPMGITVDKRGGNFKVMCNYFGKRKYLGTYLTLEKASEVYRSFRSKYIKEVACQQGDKRVREGLEKHAKLISEGLLC